MLWMTQTSCKISATRRQTVWARDQGTESWKNGWKSAGTTKIPPLHSPLRHCKSHRLIFTWQITHSVQSGLAIAGWQTAHLERKMGNCMVPEQLAHPPVLRSLTFPPLTPEPQATSALALSSDNELLSTTLRTVEETHSQTHSSSMHNKA